MISEGVVELYDFSYFLDGTLNLNINEDVFFDELQLWLEKERQEMQGFSKIDGKIVSWCEEFLDDLKDDWILGLLVLAFDIEEIHLDFLSGEVGLPVILQD